MLYAIRRYYKTFTIVASFFILILFCMLIFNKLVFGKTLILEGSIKSKIDVTQSMHFDVLQPVEFMQFKFAFPKDFTNKFVAQKIYDLDINIEPKPDKLEKQIDKYGNYWGIATWNNLATSATVQIKYQVSVGSEIKAEKSVSEFPLKNITDDEKIFLQPTKLVQSSDPEIIRLSQDLTNNAKTEYEAVVRILNWVSDNIKYTYNPAQYDALWSLKTGKGNCQNLAHIAIALLRASGIPARVVGGITLKEQWKIPIESGYLVQGMGQGGHAWIEIYFPDLGWLSYDPQQSQQFTSTRHIKQTHALDSSEVNDIWKASPYLPSYSESIQTRFVADNINIVPKATEAAPKAYILSNKMIAKIESKPPVSITPPTVHPAPVKPNIAPTAPPVVPPVAPPKIIEFGNMDFPQLVDIYKVVGNQAMKILDNETAEYVTSKYIYAQAFKSEEPLEIVKISLAMRKFGGDGTVYIDLVQDKNGKPSLEGIRSNPVFVENITKRPGYYWVDFTFPQETKLKKGKYWIVLRHSGDVIMNWFYIVGNPYGDADDTRSTLKGYKWEDILNYDFVFKVTAKRL